MGSAVRTLIFSRNPISLSNDINLATRSRRLLLGFPLYFTRLLGVWKILGGLAILAPGFPRLKEWAYAGMLFDLIGGSVASAAMGAAIGAESWHVLAPQV